MLIDSNAPPMALPSVLRQAGVADPASKLFETLRRVPQPSSRAVARSTFKRVTGARRLARVSVAWPVCP